MGAATLVAKVSWFGFDSAPLQIRSFTVPYSALALATVPTWLVILALAGAYNVGPTGVITGVGHRVVWAGAQLLAVVAVAYYVLHLAMLGRRARGADPAGGGAHAAGSHRRRADDAGPAPPGPGQPYRARRGPTAGRRIARRPAGGPPDRRADPGGHGRRRVVPGPGDTVAEVTEALAQTGAEVLVVTGGLARGRLRDLAWALQGTGVELLVTPAPAELEGLRTEIRPIAGLPLLYLDR